MYGNKIKAALEILVFTKCEEDPQDLALCLTKKISVQKISEHILNKSICDRSELNHKHNI